MTLNAITPIGRHLSELDLPELLGFAGSFVVVVLYWQSLRGRIDTAGIVYPALNLLGCALIMVSLGERFNAPSMVIELFWSAVSLYGIVRWLRRRPPSPARRPVPDR